MQNREWVDEEFELLVSSDVNNGAREVTQEGSKFSIYFDEPLGLPRGAINPTVQCMGASIWWTIPNIVDSGLRQNNLFGFTYTRVPVGITSQVVIDGGNNDFSFGVLGPSYVNYTLPPGSYTFTELVNTIHSRMVQISGLTLSQIQQFFQVSLNPVTAFVTITLDISWTGSNTTGAYFAWQQSLGFASVFGWPADQAIALTATRTGSNLIPAVPGVWSYESPAQSLFGSNVITRSGLAVPTGLYNIDQLIVSIKEQMVFAGLTQQEADNFIQLDGDNSRQLVILTLNCPISGDINTAPYAFEFGVNGTRGFDSVLGFVNWPRPGSPGPSRLLVGNFPAPGGDIVYTFVADRIAAFNRVNYLLLHTDLVPRGIRYNGNFNQIVAQVLVDVGAGQQIVYAPFNPPICDASNLVGAQRTNAQFWLTDDTNEPVNTFGETWSMRLVFKYKIAK
jgi:hypothetical protein